MRNAERSEILFFATAICKPKLYLHVYNFSIKEIFIYVKLKAQLVNKNEYLNVGTSDEMESEHTLMSDA